METYEKRADEAAELIKRLTARVQALEQTLASSAVNSQEQKSNAAVAATPSKPAADKSDQSEEKLSKRELKKRAKLAKIAEKKAAKAAKQREREVDLLCAGHDRFWQYMLTSKLVSHARRRNVLKDWRERVTLLSRKTNPYLRPNR